MSKQDRSRRWNLAMLCLVLLVGVGCASSQKQTSADAPQAQDRTTTEEQMVEEEGWSIDNAQILYTGRRAGRSNLYLLDRKTRATSQITQLSVEGVGASRAAVSPDGDEVAFELTTRTSSYIYKMALEGGEPVNLTSDPALDLLPEWSPDGQRLAFMSTRGLERTESGSTRGHIYTMRGDGSDLRQLTRTPMTSPHGPSDWDPEGNRILFARSERGQADVYVLDVATGEETQLTSDPRSEYSAAFNSDGSKIAYHSEGQDESQIAIMNVQTGDVRMITSGPATRYDPEWSPDDEWILYSVSQDGSQFDLQAIHVETGRIEDLVATPEDEREGRWLPQEDE